MVKAVPAGPPRVNIRTCVGCRARGERSQLLRVVVVQDEDAGGFAVVLDQRRRIPGRGAWLHARVDCVNAAVRRRAFGRALRVSVPLDVSELRARVAALGSMEQESGAVTDGGTVRMRTESGF